MKTKNKIKTIFGGAMALGVAAFGMVITPSVSAADGDWGPQDRTTFTWEKPASYVTINSITDNPELGDERNFVRVREAVSGTKFSDNVTLQAGKEYEVMIYFHNNASTNLNSSGKGIARNAAAKSSFSTTINKGEYGTVTGRISASNANPTEVWSTAYLHTSDTVYLSYVPNTAKFHSFGNIDGVTVNTDALFGKGVSIGYDTSGWGMLPGCNEYAGYITYNFKVDKPSFWAEKKVAHHGSADTYEELSDAKPGETLDFMIYYENNGTTKQTSVTVHDTLPEGLTLVPGSVRAVTPEVATGVTIADDKLFSSAGIDIGDFYAGEKGWVYYQAVVNDDSEKFPCGGTVIYNDADVMTNNGTIHDKVKINVNRVCTPETCETNPEMAGCEDIPSVEDCTTNPSLEGCTPSEEDCATNPNLAGCKPSEEDCKTNPNLAGCQTVTTIPETGPTETIVAIVIVILMAIGGGYWLQSYLKLNKMTKNARNGVAKIVPSETSKEVKDGIVGEDDKA